MRILTRSDVESLEAIIRYDAIRSRMHIGMREARGQKAFQDRRGYNRIAERIEEYLLQAPKINENAVCWPLEVTHDLGTKILYRTSTNVSSHPKHPDVRPMYRITQPSPGETIDIYLNGHMAVSDAGGHAGHIDGVAVAIIQPKP